MVQEAYLRAWEGIGRFRGDAQFTTWMYRITANCAATHARQAPPPPHRAARRRSPSPSTTGPSADPQVAAESADALERVSARARRAAAQAAGGRGAEGRLRPAPRGDRRRARASRCRRPRSASTGPAASCATLLYEDEGDGRPMRCDEVADAAARARSTAPSGRPAVRAPRRVVPALPGRAGPVPPAAAQRSQLLRTRYARADARACSRETLAALERGRRAPARAARSSPAAGSPTPARSAACAAAAGATAGAARRRGRRRRVRVRLGQLERRSAAPSGDGSSIRCYPRVRPPRPRRAVAQLVEHRSPKPAVGGSSPSCPAHRSRPTSRRRRCPWR